MLGVAFFFIFLSATLRLGFHLRISLLQVAGEPLHQEAAILHELIHPCLVIGAGLLKNFLKMIICLAHRRLAGLAIGCGHEVPAPTFLILFVHFASTVRRTFVGHIVPFCRFSMDSIKNHAHHLLGGGVAEV